MQDLLADFTPAIAIRAQRVATHHQTKHLASRASQVKFLGLPQLHARSAKSESLILSQEKISVSVVRRELTRPKTTRVVRRAVLVSTHRYHLFSVLLAKLGSTTARVGKSFAQLAQVTKTLSKEALSASAIPPQGLLATV